MELRRDGSIRSVRGHPDDVIRVHEQVTSAIMARNQTRRRTPWAAGSFYLVVLVVTVLLLLLAGRALPLWALPIIAVAAVLIVLIIGALQLRHDERLSERNFLKLMAAVSARLPALLRSGRPGADSRSDI
jgi:Flp pilus assembly protein TadB